MKTKRHIKLKIDDRCCANCKYGPATGDWWSCSYTGPRDAYGCHNLQGWSLRQKKSNKSR